MFEDDLQALLQTGIDAAQSGRPAVARGIFDRVIARDPNHEMAWYWKATVAETLNERRACLRRVLVINPENYQAGQELEALRRRTPAPPVAYRTARTAPLDERAALLESVEPTRRRRPIVPLALMAVAVTLMAAGAALIVVSRGDTPGIANSTATTLPDAARTATFQALSVPLGAPTATPGERIRTLPPRRDELPPTWTPTATWTPAPERTRTPGEADVAPGES